MNTTISYQRLIWSPIADCPIIGPDCKLPINRSSSKLCHYQRRNIRSTHAERYSNSYNPIFTGQADKPNKMIYFKDIFVCAAQK